ncbi:UNVERIFIED_CONTAM: hypothetical protein HDU68_005890 [Siphonaria sp. JEL0065]|nr:hypothetical protein HDU68_005890 [Siphonaria sp. JEL0065]
MPSWPRSAIRLPLPDSIIWMLQNPDITKACVGATDEYRILTKMNVEAKGFVDVSIEYNRSQVGLLQQEGLARLAARLLGLKVTTPRAIKIEIGMEKIPGNEAKTVTVFAEKPSNRVDSLVLSEFYSCIRN